MTDFIFLVPALIACLVLAGIHTYLGIHVIARGVIFVDIALAQIAALGITVAFMMGHEPDSQMAYLMGLAFTVIGALAFAFFRDDNLPQEAVIGVAFAVSSALSLLIASDLAHGMEHLKYVMNGNILWVTWEQILTTAAIYSIIGLIHFFVRKKLLFVSSQPEEARKQGYRLWLWDLFFYVSFGVIITSSVQIGGILLVFSFLIVPALCSLFFFKSLRGRLLFGWLIGMIVSVIGIGLSYLKDWPTGSTIVVTFGAILVGLFLVKKIKR